MGMIGHYIAVDNALLENIINGKENIQDINAGKYVKLDIDKSWQAIHYLICHDVAEGELPTGYVVPVMVDNAIDCDLEFGAFYLTPEQVNKTSSYLYSLDDETIRSLYDFDAMLSDEVYPISADEDKEEFYKYIHSHLMKLKEFYKKAADKSNAIIFYII